MQCNKCNKNFKTQNALNSHFGKIHNRTIEQRKLSCSKSIETKHRLNIPIGCAAPGSSQKTWNSRRKNNTDKNPHASQNAKIGWETLRARGYKPSAELTKKRLRRHKMSSLEIALQEIIQKNNLPYKFVGNSDFLIENKCPDFVNTNGEKKVIEVYGTKHKELFRSGVEDWKRNRVELFSKYGYSIVFLNEREVHVEEFVLKALA